MNEAVLKEIENIDQIIKDNLINKEALGRGLLSENIISQLRNLVEDVIVLNHNKQNNTNLTVKFEDKKYAYKELRKKCKPKFLNEFHRYLQVSKSHYTPNYDGAERLMQKYYFYLVELKDFCKNEFDIEILRNIDEYPIYDDKTFVDYYKKISDVIDEVEIIRYKALDKGRYYVEKKHPIYVNKKKFYELTLVSANDEYNKFERIIVYSKVNILPNYSISISVIEKEIENFDKKTTIKIISNWMVSIRPCEFNNLFKILGLSSVIKSNMTEYREMMKYLTNENINLLDIALMEEKNYNDVKKLIGRTNTGYIFSLLDECRKIILKNQKGTNIIKYLLYKTKNYIIRNQLNKNIPLSYMSNLCVKSECFPFEKLPFVMSLAKHTPQFEDLFFSIEPEGCEDQILARHIQNNVEQNGILYTPESEVYEYGDIDSLITKFNNTLYGNQKSKTIKKEKKHLYMEGYEISTLKIINTIDSLTQKGIDDYEEDFEAFEIFGGFETEIIDEKKEIIKHLYSDSQVGIIYGAAGTGKTTLISAISEFLISKEKIYLANTNTALDNLKRRTKEDNSNYYTIFEYIRKNNIQKDCDILIIDECSMISNEDMLQVLQIADFKMLLLVGDIHQIEAINYGNWFSYIKFFINKKSIYELSENFRTTESVLLDLWEKVRNKDDQIIEYITHNKLSSELNSSLLSRRSNDEIILCLGYDGLYGINQINKYLQDSNPNQSFKFGLKTYKVGDRVLFIDTIRFGNILYNNLKGIIKKIDSTESELYFEVEVEKQLTFEDKANLYFNKNLKLIEEYDKSFVVGFFVEKEFENDDDNEEKNNIVPFNIAYAISIHKAQGLEYESVKVVITKDVERIITPNIFYTAITRAKKSLKIYWTPETEECIMEKVLERKSEKDYLIFKNKFESILFKKDI